MQLTLKSDSVDPEDLYVVARPIPDAMDMSRFVRLSVSHVADSGSILWCDNGLLAEILRQVLLYQGHEASIMLDTSQFEHEYCVLTDWEEPEL